MNERFNIRRMPPVEDPVPGGPCAVGRYFFPEQYDGFAPCPLPAAVLLLIQEVPGQSKEESSPYGFCDFHADNVYQFLTDRTTES